MDPPEALAAAYIDPDKGVGTLEFCRDVEPTRESIWEGKVLLHLAGILLKVIAPLL